MKGFLSKLVGGGKKEDKKKSPQNMQDLITNEMKAEQLKKINLPNIEEKVATSLICAIEFLGFFNTT